MIDETVVDAETDTEPAGSALVQLPILSAKTEFSNFFVRCHSVAWSNHYQGDALWPGKRRRRYGTDAPGLLVLSATGPDTAIKALRALLYCDTDCRLELSFPGDERRGQTLAKAQIAGSQVKYSANVAKLDKGVVHLIAIAKVPGLMVNMSDDHLWQELSGVRYTTPMLRGWVGQIGKVLMKKGKLIEAEGWQTNAGILRVEQEELDKIVKNGVHLGKLKMEAT